MHQVYYSDCNPTTDRGHVYGVVWSGVGTYLHFDHFLHVTPTAITTTTIRITTTTPIHVAIAIRVTSVDPAAAGPARVVYTLPNELNPANA